MFHVCMAFYTPILAAIYGILKEACGHPAWNMPFSVTRPILSPRLASRQLSGVVNSAKLRPFSTVIELLLVEEAFATSTCSSYSALR